MAIVTDHPFAMAVPQFGLDDAEEVAGFLERRFALSPKRELVRE